MTTLRTWLANAYEWACKRLRIDARHPEWFMQRRKRGFDDRDTWSLDHTLACYILPRLKRFKDAQGGYPGNLGEQRWDAYLDDMIAAFEILADDKIWLCDAAQYRVVRRGLNRFSSWYSHLWW